MLPLVVKDDQGEIILLKRKFGRFGLAHEAETCALEWASEVAADNNWDNVIWSSDALAMVKEVSDVQEPGSWSSSSNKQADAAAKKSFELGNDLFFNFEKLVTLTLPDDLSTIAVEDQLGGVVLKK